MADNISITAGTGTTYGADEVTDGTLGSVKVGYTKLMDGTLDSTNKGVIDSSGALSSNITKVGSTAIDTNSGTKSAGTVRVVLATDQPALTNKLLVTPDLPSGAATAAKQPALGTAGSASADVISVQGIASMTAIKTDGSGVTQPVSGTVTANAGSGTMAVSAASLPLPSGASTAAKQPALGTAGTASADVLTVQGITSMTPLKTDGSGVTQPVSGTVSITSNSAVNVAQINGVTTLMGNGVTGTGSQRVTIASDNTPYAVKIDQTTPGTTNNISVSGSTGAGTSTLIKDDASFGDGITSGVMSTAGRVFNGTNYDRVRGDTTGQDVHLVPKTSGGWSTYHLASAGSTNATNIKASAGQVGGWYVYNSNAAARKLVFHNTAGTPTAGASVYFAIVIPPSSAANVEFANGIPFATGIGITTVTDLADSGTTAVAANDLIINIWYK